MSQDKTNNCSGQAAKIAAVSGLKTLMTTFDPIEAIADASATYAAARGVCEATKNDGGSSTTNNSKK